MLHHLQCSFETLQRASCSKETRVKLLNEITSCDGPWLPPIIAGIAGIGKSTISKTLAERSWYKRAQSQLFFPSRNEQQNTAKTFFPSYQLACSNEDFISRRDAALMQSRRVVKFSSLLWSSSRWGLCRGNPHPRCVWRIGRVYGRWWPLKKLADAIKDLLQIKVFITRRPERHIRIALDRYRHLRRFHLQDIEKWVVESDILDFSLIRATGATFFHHCRYRSEVCSG